MRLRLEPIRSAAGTALPTQAEIVLVDAAGVARIGWVAATAEPVTEYRQIALTEPAELALVPNAQIAIDVDGSPTFYRVTLAAPHRRESYRIQAPNSAGTFDLAALVAAAAPEPGASVLESILLATAADRAATAADRDLVAETVGSLLWLTAETDVGVTLGAGSALVTGTGSAPYDHITLTLEVP